MPLVATPPTSWASANTAALQPSPQLQPEEEDLVLPLQCLFPHPILAPRILYTPPPAVDSPVPPPRRARGSLPPADGECLHVLMESGGLMEQHAYSYTGAVGLSSFDPSRIVVRIANFTAVPAGEDGHIWALLVHRGPPAVGLHVLLMPTYVGGCRARSSARRRGVNYGVLLVSYGALGFAALCGWATGPTGSSRTHGGAGGESLLPLC
jgi:hypothetical protein